MEVHTENYMGGGSPIRCLETIRRDIPISLHGVGLSLGSAEGLDQAHLDRILQVAERIEPDLMSEHIAWSVSGGTYLAEYGRHSRLSVVVRFINDILLSAPSILIGLFIYQLIVVNSGGYSAYAGATALAVIVIPVVVRTTENMLLLVPNQLREASAALGSPRSHVIQTVTWRAARAGIITGVLLAVARISGETAPLLFTSLGNVGWSTDTLTLSKNLTVTYPVLNAPMASLPKVIFDFANYPDEYSHQLAWTGALLITLAVLTLSVLARIFESRGKS